MAQTLDHNNSITTVVPVEIPLFEDDLGIIQKLDDEPNDVGGLTAAELKAEFDKGSLTAQTYINETLIPRILADDLTEQARQAAESERVSNEIERVTNENARIQAESDRSAAEALRAAAEESRVKAEQGRASAETTRSNNETQRVSAESGRAQAEQNRAAAEAARVQAEQARVQAEQARVQAEQARVQAEQARVQAEQARVDTNSGIVARATAQANAAALSAGSAAGSASNAAASEEGAKSAQSAAEAAKADATVAKEDAETAKADAVAAKAAAEKARDDAQAIAGGDFVSVSDIVNDLVTNVSNKPLSAAQGVALKALMEDGISQLSAEVNENRTHWKESTETEIIPETSSTFKLSLVMVKGSVASGLVVGKTYLVEWNGVEYETVCFNSSSNTPVIGDDSSDVGTNYPFSIEDAEMGYYYVTVGSEFVHKTVTFKVTLVDTVYHQLDSRYIADAVIVKPQTFTEEQKAQARENIGAVGADEIDITNQKLTAIESNIDGIETTLQESGVSGAIQYQFTILEESGADVDVELSSDELVELNSTIVALRSLKKSNTAIIAFLTDLHIANAIATKIKKAIAGYNKISASVKTDLLLFGGDYLENNPTTTKEQALTLYSYLRDILSYCNDKAPAAVLKGNHDDNTMHTDYINGLIDFETFWAELGNIDDDRTVRNAGNIEDCYGYYDIPNQKVRVFYVNTVDLPQKLIEATNSVNYKGQWDTGISIEQLQFIADNLKFDTSGWHVMVFSHHPIMRDIAIENGCGVQADRGGAALLELLDKFNTGNTSGSIAVTGIDFAGTVNYDFTNNQDCKIVACVNGHTHRDNVEVYNNSFFCISTRAVYGHPSYDGHISSSAYFVVDRNNTKLHLVYNGDGEENVFDYGSLNTGEVEPSEPVYEEIASPFEWEIAVVNNTSGSIESDSQNMRISSTEIIGFTTSATIDMSAYNAMYQPYWYDTDGNYIETGASWISTSTPFTLPVDRTVRLKVRNNNYEVWTAESINTFASAVKVTVAKGGKAYTATAPEPEIPEIVLGEPIQNVLYAIGGGSSTGTKGFDVYGNGARMTALTTYGVKPLVDANDVCSGDVYFIEIPADATKVVVTSPGFIYGISLLTYANDAFTRDVDTGWQTLNGGEYLFEAGAYSHIAINFKNSSNTTIPKDTDTSGFSIMFE